jgi:N-acetyl-gamma-glutamyl-phosphate reductase
VGESRLNVAVVGATGYAGGEVVRLLARHPLARIAGLQGRARDDEPIGQSQPHLAGTELLIAEQLPGDLDAVFASLPHGAATEMVAELSERLVVIDLGPDFRLRDPAGYPRWYGFEHPRPDLLDRAVYGLPELHRDDLASLGRQGIVASPGCYSTATILALAPLAEANLLADVVVDAKSGVSGAGREARVPYLFGEVNESVRAYGVAGHRHVAEMEQELGRLAAEPMAPIDFLPHLVPMTRGILAACHVRTSRPVGQAELDDLYRARFETEPFVQLVDEPPSTKHVLGSNLVRIHVHADERTGRVLVLSVLDNLVKGAAGQAVQAFNVVFGLPEASGLEQLPLAP